VRPFAAGAVLRNLRFTPESYASFIDLQDKLHMNLARRRSLVAIGTHDLNRIACVRFGPLSNSGAILTPFLVDRPGEISYEALPPKDIKFVPLNKDTAYDAAQLMELYEVPFCPILSPTGS
jgi:phenylalanyl-tRNA synthetase beta chain